MFTEAYIRKKIEERMAELDVKHFHMETVRVTRYWGTINASNVFYFLTEKNIHPSTNIISDTGVLLQDILESESVDYPNFTFHNLKEFTGQIFIDVLPPLFNYEFIRVTPYSINN